MHVPSRIPITRPSALMSSDIIAAVAVVVVVVVVVFVLNTKHKAKCLNV